MKSVDVIFGRRLDNSKYHVHLLYVSRIDCTTDEEMLTAAMNSIPKISQTIKEVPDEVNILLGRIGIDLKTLSENLPNDSYEIVKDANLAFAELEYNGYELYFVGRGDVDSTVPYDTENDHGYMLIKTLFNKRLYDLNNFQLGVCTVFDNLYDSNLASMVMEFFVDGKFKLGNEEDEAMINLGEILETYQELSSRHQSAYMDVTKMLNLMESLGYRYIIALQ